MKFLKNNFKIIIAFVLGVILTGGIVYAAVTASEIDYTTAKNSSVKNVEQALNDLYSKVNNTSESCEFVGAYDTGKIKNSNSGELTISNVAAGKYKIVVMRTSTNGFSEQGTDTTIHNNANFTFTLDGTASLIDEKNVYEITLNSNSNIVITAGSVGTSTTCTGHIYAFLFKE